MNGPRAILFDLDGVLVNTRNYHFQTWVQVANDEGISLTRQEFDHVLRGMRRTDVLHYLTRGRDYSDRRLQSMIERKNQYFLECVRSMTAADLVPGVLPLLSEIRQAGIKTAVASASKNTKLILERLALTTIFDGIADGFCVCNGKPAADIFLFAAGLVNVPVASCLALDDKAANIRHIQRTGMHALGIGEKGQFHSDDLVLPTLAYARLHDIFLCVSHCFL